VSSQELFAGKWILEDTLGEGGVGTVYKARYESSNYTCAIKILRPQHKLTRDVVSRFVNEAKISNHIGHPGVCRVIDVGWTDEELPFLVMEFLEGESVEDIIGQGPGFLRIGESLRITKQVLEVLVAAHEAGIVHRDIKPDNVFITRDGSVKVLDFGVARMSGSNITRVGAPLGTLGFMAPEVARGDTRATGPRADVWSVGAMLFELLTGEMALDLSACEGTPDMLRHSASTPARSLATVLPRCPARLVEVVDGMLARSPEDRLTAKQALEALSAVPIPAGLVGQNAPWVWDPGRVVARGSIASEIYDEVDFDLELEVGDGVALPAKPDRSSSSGVRGFYVVGDTFVDATVEADGSDDPDEELDELHARIREDPSHDEDLHRLVDLYLELGRRDAAIAVSRTLRYLGRASVRELELAEELDGIYRPPRARVTRKQWREVLMGSHPSAQLSALLARLWPVLAASESKTYAELGLDPAERVVPSTEARGAPRWLAYMAHVLDMTAPDLFAKQGDRGDFEFVVAREGQALFPTLLAGEEVIAPQPPAARAFRIGRALAYAHPYLIAAVILPSSLRLRDAVHGAAALTWPQVKIPDKHLRAALEWRDQIEEMLIPDRIESLRKSVGRVIGMGGGDTKAWLRGCDFTAARVGLLLSDDIGVAAEVIEKSSFDMRVDGHELIEDLVAFSVSAPYLDLRRELQMS
jgi:tRNA A-37 threonylcarbamoyl transferase component Bud32